MWNFFKIASNTFKESVREPVFCLLLVCALVLIAHFPSVALFVFYEQLKTVVDSSMATSMLFGLFAAVLASSHTVAQEMRNGTVLLLLSKPVHRWSFVLAKIFGIVAAVILFMFILNCATVVAVYIAVDQFNTDDLTYYMLLGIMVASAVIGMLLNFFRGSSFSSGMIFSMSAMIPLFMLLCVLIKDKPLLDMADLSKSLILLFGAVSAMATIAVAFAVRLDMVANLCLCTVVFFLGMVSSFLFQRETGSVVLDTVLGALYAVFPNWQFFWLADAIAGGRHIPWTYVIKSFIYVIAYIALCSLWAVALFQRREIAKDTR